MSMRQKEIAQYIYHPTMEVNTKFLRRPRIHLRWVMIHSWIPVQSAASYNLTIIGDLRWTIELGRIDIITKVSLLSSHIAHPRERHLEAAVHVMTHVGKRYKSRLVYEPLYPEIDCSFYKECDWLEIYRDAKEAIPLNAP